MSKSRGKGRTANTAPKKRNIAVIISLIVIIVLFAGALLVNSNYLRRHATAVEANGMKFTASEYQFFYINAITEYNNYINNTYGDQASFMLPDSSKPLDAQINPDTNQPWSDYYKDTAMSDIQLYSGSYQEAVANGYTIPDEDYTKVDEEINALVSQINEYYKMPFDEYLSMQFGPSSGVNEQLYREMSKKLYFVDMYAQSVNDAFSYTDEQLKESYSKNSDDYDVFKYRYFTVRAENLDIMDFESAEAYEEADKAVVDAAREKAAAYVESISNEQDFIEKAREIDAELYENDTATLNHVAGANLPATFAAWAKDPARKQGDMCTEDVNKDESLNRAFYVVYFVERINNDYPTINVQLMLLTGQTISSADFTGEDGVINETTYNAALEDAETALTSKADELFAEWQTSGGTLDYLTEYYAANASFTYGALDAYSGTISGSLYENVYYSYTQDDQADAWMHDPARLPGDITVVKGTNSNTYFLLYFIGQDMNYCDYLADATLRLEDRTVWEDVFYETPAQIRWAMRLL